MQWSSGGIENTKNKVEQNNVKQSAWAMEGTLKAMVKLFPNRFNEDGSLKQSCKNAQDETLWGEDNCKTIIEDWVKTIENPAACLGEDCDKVENLKCFAENKADGAEQKTTDLCDLVTLKYGYSQW
jgi:hypothetical protein